MKYLNIENWNRKQHYEHFRNLEDPFFGVTVNVDVTTLYKRSKLEKKSFFAMYLHACLVALNSIENFKYRIQEDKVFICDTIHASATIAREDHTFGFSFIHYAEDLEIFNKNFLEEKERILNSTDLFPPIVSDSCIYCSALPWFTFTSQKEPVSGVKNESIPKLSFGKTYQENDRIMMPVAIAANHALVDGYHIGLFFEEYQKQLDKNT
ncbi:chloramphenicol acetyltransferase [Polaribacter sp. R2A056_3_33]|jgi:chloramphenicol O-acetyltransferase type A|uniref:chloramphenicol acetyltransferase n=1 Tax=unclassified Polaribacter TaxID=196858 RepID=UPI001C4F71BC|nr:MULTISPECIES: chloramphenicol acetyltransferase [unclassified Polaribacter]QXP64864.1 chloramphenicol acetyltransferase [Polaribacter sp. HaHaR_3_91]QXP69512.1 chloramphenicol acetyltransferase [Polaribacter sp. R2A056_3_33]